MLARLRHDAFVRRDDDKREIDAGRAGDHRAHERFVPGHVDDAHGADAVEHERREAQLDRDAAAFFFGQAVGVDARERANERRLAVVDVSGGSENHATGSCATRPLSASCSHASKARKRPVVGQMLANELAKQALVRARFLSVDDRMRFAAQPVAQRRARASREGSSATREVRTSRAEHAAHGMAERRRRVTVDDGVAFGARVDGRRDAKLREKAPAAGERDVARTIGRRLAPASSSTSATASNTPAASASWPKRSVELRDRAGAGEALETRAEARARARHVERAQRVEVAARLGVQLRRALREEIERGAEPLPGRARTACEDRPHSGVARQQADDAR